MISFHGKILCTTSLILHHVIHTRCSQSVATVLPPFRYLLHWWSHFTGRSSVLLLWFSTMLSILAAPRVLLQCCPLLGIFCTDDLISQEDPLYYFSDSQPYVIHTRSRVPECCPYLCIFCTDNLISQKLSLRAIYLTLHHVCHTNSSHIKACKVQPLFGDQLVTLFHGNISLCATYLTDSTILVLLQYWPLMWVFWTDNHIPNMCS